MADVSGISVVIDDDDNSVRVDPVSGTVEQDQPDGGVVVHLDAHRPSDTTEDKFYDNLVDKIDQSRLGQIANDLYDAIEADDRSRANYLAIKARGMDYLGLEIKEPRVSSGDATSAGVDGQSQVTNPMLLEACLKGWANAQAELLPSEGPCKVESRTTVDQPQDDDLAESLERDVNHYLTVTASEYVPDTSHMLLWGVYFGGSGFKKVYRCPLRRRPVSDSVDAKDLIVSDTSKDLRSCERITHQIPMRPSVMKRMQMIGAYRDTTLTQPTSTPGPVDEKVAGIQGTQAKPSRPEDQPYTVWETQCELDLQQFAPDKFKGKNIPLPYLVTVDKDSREILAVRRDWREDDDNCERKRLYVKYPYVPGPGFYGTGMLNILGNASAAMTAAWRMSLDTGMYANFPSGLIAKLGGRQNTSNIMLAPATLQPIETAGQDIRAVVAPLPYKDVTPGLLTLIDKITQQCEGLGGSAEAPTAEGVQNVPVGTMLAQIEQATKVMAAAHKGMHQAQAEELKLLVDLFRETPEDFWKGNEVCPDNYWDEQKLLKALDDCRLVPRSDPNTPSHIHRVAKAIAIAQLFLTPQFAAIMDPREALLRILNVMREPPEGLILPPQPQAPAPPDPNMIAAQAKMIQAQTGQQKAISDAQSQQQDAQIQQAKLQGEQDIAQTDLAKEAIIHQSDAADAQREHGLAVAAHSLKSQDQAHQQQMDIAQHALNVHQAMNPPQPAKPGA